MGGDGTAAAAARWVPLVRAVVADRALAVLDDRLAIPQWLAIVVSGLGLVAALLLDGGGAILCGILAVLGAVAAALLWGLRRLLAAVVRRVVSARRATAPPEVDAALREAGLPTGGWSALRFAWRNRKSPATALTTLASGAQTLADRFGDPAKVGITALPPTSPGPPPRKGG